MVTTSTVNKKSFVNNSKHQIGAVIVQLMEALNIDESTLAEACQISLASLSRIKNNPESNPTVSTLRPIADFFNITLDQLLGYSPLSSNISNIKKIPVISKSDIFSWLDNKIIAKPIEQWIVCDIAVSDFVFATDYKIDSIETSNSPVLQNCLVIVDPKREYKHDDLVLIYNNKIKQYFLRIISFDDQNRCYIKSIEPGFAEYILLNDCLENIKILGVVVESRLQYF